jgi:hypothetical protein
MSVPAKPEATDVFTPPPKLFAAGDGEPPRRDLGDPIVVTEIAEEIICGKRRGATMVSAEETMAIARLACASFLVTACVLEMIALDDADAPLPQLKAMMRKAVFEAKEFPARFQCRSG